jgi:hypothetical protein
MLLVPEPVAPLVPLVAVPPVEPDVLGELEPLPLRAFVRMKRSLAAPDVPLVAPEVAVEPVPDVPVAPLEDESARCTHPVTVIVPALLCRELLDCDEDVWAPAPAVKARATAAALPIHTLDVI